MVATANRHRWLPAGRSQAHPERFWRTLNRKIKSEVAIPQNRHVYQIGETFGGYDLVSSYVNNGQLDAQFNFNLYDVAKYVF